MFISIKNRLIFLLIVFTLIPFVVLKIIAYPRVLEDVKEIQLRNLQGIGNQQAELVSNWVHERMKNARSLAKNPTIINAINITKKPGDSIEIITYLDAFKKEYDLAGILICDDKGIVSFATSEEITGRDISQEDYFKKAIEGKTVTSGIIQSNVPLINEMGEEETGMPTLLITSPITGNQKTTIGIVALRLDLNNLKHLMFNTKLGKTGETYLVNEQGYMITESRFSDHLKEMGIVKKRCSLELKLTDPNTGKLTSGVARCLSGNDGHDSDGYTDYAGITVLGVWRWLPEFKWGVITEIDRDEGYGLAYNLRYIVVIVLMIFAFPATVAAFLVARQISIPILRLRSMAEKIASSEDLSQRIDIKHKDEIGSLADAFNTMVNSLKEKTNALANSENRYRQLFNSLKEGVYESEPGADGVFTWINQAGAEILGYNSPEEVFGTKVKNIYVDPVERKRLVEKLEKDGVWSGFVSFCKKKNGEQFYTERTSNMIKDENGKPILIYGVFRDITERKKLEEELQKMVKSLNEKTNELANSEKRYKQLFNSLKEGVYECKRQGSNWVFTWINKSGAEILGYNSSEEVIGNKVESIYVDPDDCRRLVEKLENEGVWSGFVSFCKKKDGEHFYTERTSTMIKDENGKPVLIYGVFRDITERKKLEEELQKSEKHHRELLNSISEGVYQSAPTLDGVFTYINQSGAEILGYDSPEEVLGTRVIDIYVNANDRKELLEILEKEGVCKDFTAFCKKKNGERFIYEANCSIVRDETGQPIMIEGIFRDITER
ncbi:MAG: PAS domain S-box protein [Candidatus Kuenenia sp.]|nr:PAS domain S-box protein [Candidatus Kuenenia hertensis]